MNHELPKAWQWSTVESVAAASKYSVVDGPFGSNLKVKDYISDGVPVLQGKNITNNEFKWFDVRYISEEKAEELNRSSVVVGDILIVKIGSIGYSAILDDLNGHEVAIIPANLAKVTLDIDRIDRRFFHLWMTSPDAVRLLRKSASKTAQPALSLSKIKAVPVPLPPLTEQKRIAAILDKADAIRRKRQDAIALADTFLRSVFQNMFGFSKDLHKRWETKKVRETGKVQLGRQRSPKYQTGEYTTRYVRVANVFEDRIDLTSLFSMDFNEKDYPKYELQYGDILLNEGQSTELVGRPAMWRNEVANCCYQNTLVRFQVDSDQLTPEYALHLFLTYFRAGEFAKISSKTSSVAHLGAGRFADMLMPLPPLSMQKKFSGIVQQYQKVKDDLKIAVTQNNDLFSSLQQRAFRGDL